MTAPTMPRRPGSRRTPGRPAGRSARARRRWLLATLAAAVVAVSGTLAVRSATGDGTPGPRTVGPAAVASPSPASSAPAPDPAAAVPAEPAPGPVGPDPAVPAVTGPIGPNPPPATDGDVFASTTRVLLPVEVQGQLPSLPNGCEATSLSMLLSAVGAPVDKALIAREQDTDPGQPVFAGAPGDLTRIASWGDPEQNFVGNVTGRYGYGVYHAPLARLLDRRLPGRARDLTGGSFQDLVRQVDSGTPVVVWNTTSLRPTDQWVTWAGPAGPVRATFKEHAVLLVGHTPTALIINNPLTGRQETVPAEPFITAWRQLGRQALTVTPA